MEPKIEFLLHYWGRLIPYEPQINVKWNKVSGRGNWICFLIKPWHFLDEFGKTSYSVSCYKCLFLETQKPWQSWKEGPKSLIDSLWLQAKEFSCCILTNKERKIKIFLVNALILTNLHFIMAKNSSGKHPVTSINEASTHCRTFCNLGELTDWKLPVKLGSELAIVQCGQHTIQASDTSSGESLSLRVPRGLT